MKIEGNRIFLQSLDSSFGEAILALEIRNQEFFKQFTIERDADFYTLESQLKRLRKKEKEREDDKGYLFGIFQQESQELIGEIDLFKIERGPAQCAMVGYSLDKSLNGNGYMTEAIKLVVNHAFHDLELHRLEAGVMPHNLGSIRALEKSGFHKEGIAEKNVKINGRWEDHQMLAIVNPED
ncbi:RimJ/RimL family protein N-acetyltransferase [Virgibacillus phasianinus]|uniref:RimJ/RimL family protein N-acetyltransferase n=1 Tax=Virgibacillus phasianinus TaxID=2017483 RepID=A0A220U2T8_9BACI|nr:GNAT family protein [Virgibacillus phasianinus]ASK62236.1 RimJ/RimL family protein N-acetyltransferase [Virgibacillus phasianinus]